MTVFEYEMEIYRLSRQLASLINLVINGKIDPRMTRQMLEVIRNAFTYISKYYKIAHKDTMAMLCSHSLSFQGQGRTHLIACAYSRIIELLSQYNSAVSIFEVTGDREVLLKELHDIRRGIRSIYL